MSTLVLLRAFTFVVLPLLLAGIFVVIDKRARTKVRRIEVFLSFMFAFSAASGIAGAMGHLFAADLVAESIGWAPGSLFQLEMGFANLAFGVLAAISVGRRDGFREATVVGGAILSLGAFAVHMLDVIQHGNYAPGNILININNLSRPALLILLLWTLRRVERAPGSEANDMTYAIWQANQAAISGAVGALIGIGFGIGMALNQPFLGLALGLAAGLAVGWLIHTRGSRSPVVSSLSSPAG